MVNNLMENKSGMQKAKHTALLEDNQELFQVSLPAESEGRSETVEDLQSETAKLAQDVHTPETMFALETMRREETVIEGFNMHSSDIVNKAKTLNEPQNMQNPKKMNVEHCMQASSEVETRTNMDTTATVTNQRVGPDQPVESANTRIGRPIRKARLQHKFIQDLGSMLRAGK